MKRMAAYSIGLCVEIHIQYYEIYLHVAYPSNDKMCMYYFFHFQGMVQKRGKKLYFCSKGKQCL